MESYRLQIEQSIEISCAAQTQQAHHNSNMRFIYAVLKTLRPHS